MLMKIVHCHPIQFERTQLLDSPKGMTISLGHNLLINIKGATNPIVIHSIHI